MWFILYISVCQCGLRLRFYFGSVAVLRHLLAQLQVVIFVDNGKYRCQFPCALAAELLIESEDASASVVFVVSACADNSRGNFGL